MSTDLPTGFNAECDNRSAQVIFVESAKAVLALVTPVTICAILCALCTAISVFSVFFYRYELKNIVAQHEQSRAALVKGYEQERNAMIAGYEKEKADTGAKVRVLQNHVDEATNKVAVLQQLQEKRYATR